MNNTTFLSAHQKAVGKVVAKQALILLVGVACTTLAFGAGFEESAQKADTLFKNILKWGTIWLALLVRLSYSSNSCKRGTVIATGWNF